MPMPPKPAAKKPAAKKPVAKAAPKKGATKKAAAKKAPAKKTTAKPVAAPAEAAPPEHDHSKMDHGSMAMPEAAPTQADAAAPPVDHSTMDHSKMDHSKMDHGQMPMPAEPVPGATTPPVDHSTMDHSSMNHSATGEGAGEAHAGHGSMTGALGSYPMTRDASGTAWQPDASSHMGVMGEAGGWNLMGHGALNLVFDHQSGRRGDDKTFVSGMLMGMASHPVGDGTVQFRAMLSPDPLMGKSGYPLLLASGETANGVDRLIDRQHPHDFFMELSASLSQNIGPKSSVFIYGGLPGEPAFGPPAFMHREAIMDSPEAPISHHWLDSTHITFGVLTAGVVLDRFKVEVSRFNGREPDEHRWNIETGPLDSTSVRVSWNPTRTLSLQGSWGHFVDSEQLEPGVNQRRWSASALFADDIAPGWKFAGTLAWGRKTIDGHSDDAFVAEASVKNGPWTIYGRGEITENSELLELEDDEGEEGHGPAFTVGKVSLGAIRDFAVAKHVAFGVGGQVAVNFIPEGLFAEYGGSNPLGAMGFLRLKVN